MPPARSIEDAARAIPPLASAAMDAARARQAILTKPAGALGRLEDLVIRLAGMTGEPLPLFPHKAVVVAAADHGVAAGGVSAYPPEVTAEMVANFLRAGAAINVLARQQGATVTIVDAGVATEVPPPDAPGGAVHFLSRRLGAGTADMRHGPAMSHEQATQAVEAGIALVPLLQERGLDLLATGDMGIGNTTAAAAITAAITGASPDAVTGRGTGLDDAGLAHKREAVAEALRVNAPVATDSLDVLAKVGGFEIGVLAGLIVGAAGARVPVVLDGYISGAAALIAGRIAPASLDYCIAGHHSAEPGHTVALDALGLTPYLSLGMRLGEGTGAVLAFSLVEAATRTLREMATFDEAGVSGPDE